MLDSVLKVITILTPLLVAYLTYIGTKQQKQTKEFIELQNKFNDLTTKAKKEEIEEQKKTLETLKNGMEKLESEVTSLKTSVANSRIAEQLENILEITQVNFEYSQSLSQVICSIGEVFDSNSSPTSTDKFKSELKRHQSDERKLMNRIFKKAY